MHPEPTSPLGQAFAAIIALLIAALAEHAAEHPMLAPGLRAAIRKLEKLSKQFRAMAADWESTRTTPTRRAGFTPPPRRHPPRRPAIRRGTAVSAPRRRVAIATPATAPRAPPAPAPRIRPPTA